jgi:hypothetical protein
MESLLKSRKDILEKYDSINNKALMSMISGYGGFAGRYTEKIFSASNKTGKNGYVYVKTYLGRSDDIILLNYKKCSDDDYGSTKDIFIVRCVDDETKKLSIYPDITHKSFLRSEMKEIECEIGILTTIDKAEFYRMAGGDIELTETLDITTVEGLEKMIKNINEI